MMKRFAYFLIAGALLAGCARPDIGPISLTGSDLDTFDGETVRVDGSSQTFSLSVSGSSWEVASASNDIWLSAWSEDEGTLKVKVTANEGDTPRSSVILIHNAGSSAKVTVEQDYLKYLNFATSENIIEAASGEVSVPVSTNIPTEGMNVSSSDDWVSDFSIADNKLHFKVTANPSEESARTATLTIRSGLFVTTTKVTQVAMSGFPYQVAVSSLDFSRFPIYDLIDAERDIKVGRACKEYLYKVDPLSGEEIVNGSFIVCYPYIDGKVNYTKGIVWNDGSTVSWKEQVSVNDKGSDHIAWFEKADKTPGNNLYMGRGATSFRLEALSAEDAANATILAATPLIYNDERSGAADNHGQTEESFSYPLVKVGMQIWQKNNLRTTRFADGTPIPTGLNRYTGWQTGIPGTQPIRDENGNEVKDASGNSQPVTYTNLKPICMIAGTGSSSTFDDANDPSDAAVNARNTYGVSYTYACIMQQTLDFPVDKSAVFDKNDKLSPQGWKVPSRNDFQILLNYLQQGDIQGNEARMADLLSKVHSGYDDLTGFSAIGLRQKGPSGGYNNVLYYWSTDYRYLGAQHLVAVLRLLPGNYIPLFDLTVSAGVYVRLVKEDME